MQKLKRLLSAAPAVAKQHFEPQEVRNLISPDLHSIRNPLSRVLEASEVTSAMIAMYVSTSGAMWSVNKNWLNEGMSVCDWYQVSCENNEVLRIHLQNNNLLGMMPTEIGFFTSLLALHLYGNSIHGSLPSEFGSMLSLTADIDLFDMSISGQLPSQFGRISTLHRNFQIGGNDFSGTVPTEVGSITALSLGLFFDSNSFTGSLPTEIGRLTALSESLSLHSNSVVGQIPTEIGQLTALLRNLWLDSNEFSGTMPSELGRLTGFTSSIDFDGNLKLCGTLPSEVFELKVRVTDFDFHGTAVGSPCQLTTYPTASPIPTVKSLNDAENNDDIGNKLATSDLDPLLIASYTLALLFVFLVCGFALFRASNRVSTRRERRGFIDDLTPIANFQQSDSDEEQRNGVESDLGFRVSEHALVELRNLGEAIIDGMFEEEASTEVCKPLAENDTPSISEVQDEVKVPCHTESFPIPAFQPNWKSISSLSGMKSLPPLRAQPTGARDHELLEKQE
jgi:hypothetical protein